MQTTHENNKFSTKKHAITLVCDHITSAANVGSLFRMADALGIEQIIFCGKQLPKFSKRMEKTARSTHQFVPFLIEENIETILDHLHLNKYHSVALEITNKSAPLEKTDFTHIKKIALIIGDENFGVSETVLKKVTLILHITMYGNNSSMNVAQATGIALYEIVKQWNF
ncbi:TrmH family RNA methyltransferase [Zhouia sp. PK063]|uniref:TrmH family RNA methyltransferase n=1 Tax=Zhouia sp. PK063 TaxID=3373602 RepID=UPI0037A06A53